LVKCCISPSGNRVARPPALFPAFHSSPMPVGALSDDNVAFPLGTRAYYAYISINEISYGVENYATTDLEKLWVHTLWTDVTYSNTSKKINRIKIAIQSFLLELLHEAVWREKFPLNGCIIRECEGGQ